MQKALTVFGSLITCTSQLHFAESGRKRTACAIRRSVIWRTFSRAASRLDFLFLAEIAISSVGPRGLADRHVLGHHHELLRPVIDGGAASERDERQRASQCMCLKKNASLSIDFTSAGAA